MWVEDADPCPHWVTLHELRSARCRSHDELLLWQDVLEVLRKNKALWREEPQRVEEERSLAKTLKAAAFQRTI